jgi:hypothetical protein
MDSNNPSTVSSTDHLAAKLSALIQQDITVYCPGHNHSGTYTARVLEVDHTRLKRLSASDGPGDREFHHRQHPVRGACQILR